MRIIWRKEWKIWDEAEVVDHIKTGDYEIRVSLFPLWKDQKHISDNGNCYNVSKIGRFGFFDIVESLVEKCLMLCYNDPRNGFFSRRIVDYVRHIPNTGLRGTDSVNFYLPGGNLAYTGWFGIRILWFWIRISPFTMIKIGD